MTIRRFLPVLLAPLVLLSPACTDPAKKISIGSYENAVGRGMETELAQRGISLARRPQCHTSGADQAERGGAFVIRCDSVTAQGDPVVTEGEITGAGTPGQRERYRVSLGTETLFQGPCIGTGCH